MSTRLIKIFRDLWSNKTRTILVIISIAVGVLSVGATLTMQSVLSRELDANWSRAVPASGQVFAGQGVKPSFIESVQQMPEVAIAEGRNNTFIRVLLDPNDPTNFKYINLSAITDFDNIRLNKVDPVAGVWPPARREIALSTVSLQLLNVKVGDTITIADWVGRKMNLRITGTFYTPDEAGGTFAFAANGVVNLDTWTWMGNQRDAGTILFRLKQNTNDFEANMAVAEQIKKRVEREGQTASINVNSNPDQHPAGQSVTAIVGLLVLIGVVSLVLSGFLVINTVSAVLAQHVRQIGMMKTVGARNGQLRDMYFAMVLAYGILSLFVALPLGLLAAQGVISYLGVGLLNLRVSSYSPPGYVFALQVALALLAPVMAAIAPVFSGTRRTVREAISDYGIDASAKTRERPGILSRLLPLSRPTQISLRNTFRRKGRLAMTMIVLTLAGAIFIGVISARQGIVGTLDTALSYWGWDIDLGFDGVYSEEQVNSIARSVPGVAAVESWGWGNASLLDENRRPMDDLSITAPPHNTKMIAAQLTAGRWLVEQDTDAVVLNSEVLKRNPGIKLGDTIRVRINGDIRSDLRVVGIVQAYFTGSVGYMNKPAFLKLARYGSKVGYIAIKANTPDADRHAAISRALQDEFKRAGIKINNTQLTAQSRAQIKAQFDVIIVMMLAMSALLALVGGLGLAGTMSINVIERTREIGVMRAVGAGNGQVRAIVIFEGVLIGVISWLIAAVLSLPFSIGITALLGNALELQLINAFSVEGLFGWLAAVVVIATVASVLPAMGASKLTVREVLAYQ
jgi:putative ABC transport system permease protein